MVMMMMIMMMMVIDHVSFEEEAELVAPGPRVGRVEARPHRRQQCDEPLRALRHLGSPDDKELG
jgi:hypothetical protein